MVHNKRFKIWYQSFVDANQETPYTELLQSTLDQYAATHVNFEVHGISPPDHYLNPLSEFRCASQAIQNAIEAEQKGYDAYVMGHFQEPGLIECRSAVNIPVLGLGEANMLYASSIGRSFGLVTIHPAFLPWHRDQIVRLGFAQRSVGVRAVNTQVSTYIEALENKKAYQALKDDYYREAKLLVEAGAEVIILAGGLPMLLLTRDKDFRVEEAIVLNGIAVITAMTEMAIKLFQQTGVTASRQGTFAKVPPESVQEFLVSLKKDVS